MKMAILRYLHHIPVDKRKECHLKIKTTKMSKQNDIHRLHSVLSDFNLSVDDNDDDVKQPTSTTTTTTQTKSKNMKYIDPVLILNHLLQTNVISPEHVRSSVKYLQQQQKQQENQKEEKEKKDKECNKKQQQKESVDDQLKDQIDNAAAATAAQNSSTTTCSTATTSPAAAATTAVRRRHIALKFYYDGGNYSGLAQNIGQDNDNSIEKAIFHALVKSKLIESRNNDCGYSRCGRTDRGVSSAGQVIALQLKSSFPIDASTDEEGTDIISNEQLPKNEFDSLKVWVVPKMKQQKQRNKEKKKKNKQNHATQTSMDVDASTSTSTTTASTLTTTTDTNENTTTTAVSTATSTKRQRRTLREINEYSYAKILNNLLPSDIRILGWVPVSDDFSARFSATTRTYRYFFILRNHITTRTTTTATTNDNDDDDYDNNNNSDDNNKNKKNNTNNYQQIDSLSKIQQGLNLLTGKHDFRNFCKMDVEKVYNFERIIHDAQVIQVGTSSSSSTPSSSSTSPDSDDRKLCYIQIIGQAFLWHQIRCIVQILLYMVGKGLEEPSIIKELLDITKYPGKPSYPLAPERPLVLHSCGYRNIMSFGYSVSNIWNVVCHFEKQWEELTLAAARIRNCIDSFYKNQQQQQQHEDGNSNTTTTIDNGIYVLKRDVEAFAKTKVTERNKKRRRSGLSVNNEKESFFQIPAEYDDENNANEIEIENGNCTSTIISWTNALKWLRDRHGLVPEPSSSSGAASASLTSVHIPLSQRSMGTTYEEKVEAIQKSNRRREKYEENVIKKRKTSEEDAEFYRHMTRQGGDVGM